METTLQTQCMIFSHLSNCWQPLDLQLQFYNIILKGWCPTWQWYGLGTEDIADELTEEGLYEGGVPRGALVQHAAQRPEVGGAGVY